jgi:pimeloyl-ACP methyl ester carboxylesterase
MGGWAMGWLAHELRAAGFRTRAVSYDSVSGGLDEHLERLQAELAEAEASAAERVHFVGHSMGGVLALQFLGRARPANVGRAVLLGAPARGSQAALAFERQAWGPMMLGRSAELWHGPFLDSVQAGLEVGAIAGNERFGLGALLVALPGANDGVVTVEETRIEGLKDHLEMAVSHTGMLFSRPVAQQVVAFLQTGAFMR